jgi:hypothetical protein
VESFASGPTLTAPTAALPVEPPLAQLTQIPFLEVPPILEFLWVHEADRDSRTVEDAHHLTRHVMCDDWALCAAAA